MSNPNHIASVTLTIETNNGEMHKLVVAKPGPFGDNPRFMAQQLATAMDELHRRADDVIETYGSQIRSA